MNRTNGNALQEAAFQIALRQPGEKLTYRLRCKIKYELKKLAKKFSPNIDLFNAQNEKASHKRDSVNNFSYSECLQDRFVLEMTARANGRHYLEIGSGPAKTNNNTFLLEEIFGWQGLSIDFNPEHISEFRIIRNNHALHADATTIDYSEILSSLNFPRDLGYLQIDIDPSYQSLLALFKIPFEKYRFATITFEHDLYRTSAKIASIARKKLTKEGYVLVVKNVLAGHYKPFEDWWVHPELVDVKTYSRFFSRNVNPANLPF